MARQRDPNAWKLLLGCSLFDQDAGVTREALGYITDLSLVDRDDIDYLQLNPRSTSSTKH